MSNIHTIELDHISIYDYLEKNLGGTNYFLEDHNFMRKEGKKLFFFDNYIKVGEIYYMVYSPGNLFRIDYWDEELLKIIEPICNKYSEQLNNYSFKFVLNKKVEIK